MIEYPFTREDTIEQRAAIVATARTLVGCPFRLQGIDPATGLDCRGLVLYCYAQHGWVPRCPELTLDRKYRLGDGQKLRAVLQAECDPITLKAAHPADIVLLREAPEHEVPEQEATHCGIMTHIPTHSEPRFLICHASYPQRRVVEHHVPETELWRIQSVWRVKSLGLKSTGAKGAV